MSDGGVGNLTYEGSKAQIQSGDWQARAEIARHPDSKPEILYYLAEDESAEVRAEVAANRSTPYQADVLLSQDRDEEVRAGLAHKVARVLPDLGPNDRKRAEAYVTKVLETLARDEAVRVRQVLADTVKTLSAVPPGVVQSLARDEELVVSAPVLEFSPLLSEADLVAIIDGGCASGQLQAISRRRGLSAPVADAIVAVDDEPAVTSLLGNESAQIREETLDQLVERARKVSAWHAPLVTRPLLPMPAVRKLATFVADRLLEQLESRRDLDRKTVKSLAKEVKKRLAAGPKEEDAPEPEPPESEPEVTSFEELCELEDKGELTEDLIALRLGAGDRDFVRTALAVKADLGEVTVGKVVSAQSAKGMVALTWKAGLSPEFCVQLQTRLGGVAPPDVLRPRSGRYPLNEEEMNWQIELFESMAG